MGITNSGYNFLQIVWKGTTSHDETINNITEL